MRSTGRGVFVPWSRLGEPEFDAAEDHRQLGRGDAQLGGIRLRAREGALLQPAEVEGEPVPLPGQDLQPVSALVAEHVQVARERVLAQMGCHNRLKPVETFATILRGRADPDPAGQPEGQHGAPRNARTNRATAATSAATGARRMIPPGTTISTVGSEVTRTAANDGFGAGAGAFGDGLRRASSRRLAKKVDSPSPRAAQNAVTVRSDSFQAVIASRQN